MKLMTGYEDAKVRKAWSDEHATVCKGDSLTVQSDSKEADINFIMERYARTGQFPGLSRLPSYGDFEGITDYREAIHAVRDAEELFMQLPAKVRLRFDNDPQTFADFCGMPENRLELAQMGLLTKEAADAVRKEVEASQEASGDAEGGRAASAARREPGRPVAAGEAREGSGAGGSGKTT